MKIRRCFFNPISRPGSQLSGFIRVEFVSGEFMFSAGGIAVFENSAKEISLRFPAQKYGQGKLRFYFKADNKEFEDFLKKAVKEELEAVRIFNYKEEE